MASLKGEHQSQSKKREYRCSYKFIKYIILLGAIAARISARD